MQFTHAQAGRVIRHGFFTTMAAMSWPAVALLSAALFGLPAWAADRSQARSMVITRQGIVATEQPLASQIGATILAQGGNAVDAAVAANAAMGVFAPMANGLGGDLFVMVYEAKTGKLYGLNASGWAPAGLTPEFLKGKGISEMPQSGIHSVTVPGVADGWDKLLKRFGRKTLPEVLAPAIHYAEEGFPVTEIFASYWADSEAKLRRDTNAARVYLPQGRAPRTGEIFRNPDLAWSLRQVAAQGPKAVYAGPVGERILARSRELGGTLTAEDLASFSSEWVEPISTTYHGWTVYELPPNGQGIAALMMLNLMENFPLAQYGPGSADALHVMIEAKKLAYADMLRYVGDPKFSTVPVAGLLSKDYARRRAKLLDMAKAQSRVEPGLPLGTDTTYLCVVDEEGNMVSYIQSNYSSFGSGVVAPGTGFALQNRGGLFSLDADSPNVLAGRKRPLAHDHSGVLHEGRGAHRLRYHGRLEPVAGARAVRLEPGGPPHEHPGGVGGAAVHEAYVRRMRRGAGSTRAGSGPRRAGGPGTSNRAAGRLR